MPGGNPAFAEGKLLMAGFRYCLQVYLWTVTDSLVVVLSGNGTEVHMDTLEVLTLLLVIFTALSYLDNHRK